MKTDLFNNAKNLATQLNETLDDLQRELSESQNKVMEMSRQDDLSQVDSEAFKAFMKRPYVLRQMRNDHYELTIPRFIGLTAGWPVRTDGEYDVFIVSRMIDMITPLPEWLRHDLKWDTKKFDGYLDGDWLVVTKGDAKDLYTKLGGHKSISGQDGNRLRIIQRQRFDVIRDLIRQGILPYRPKPLAKEMLRPVTGKVVLRPKQLRDYQTFLKYSAVSAFATGGAGKTFFGIYACENLKGKKVIFAPRRAILEQWKYRIQTLCPQILSEIEFRTYQSLVKHPLTGKYGLVIYDEIQHMPANMGIRASQVDTVARIGLSATPWREDDKEDIIPALCGVPVASDWDAGKTADATVWLTDGEVQKYQAVENIMSQPVKGKTLIFVYRIEVGERLSKLLGVPFVHGGTPHQFKAISAADTCIVSKIADAGISMDVTRMIEFDFLGGRSELGQRALRTNHSEGEAQVHILMTKNEYKKSSYRLSSLKALNFSVNVVGA